MYKDKRIIDFLKVVYLLETFYVSGIVVDSETD